MPRLPRFDRPGRWFHIMNRGLARRSVFESRRDFRYFLSRIAHAVRRGDVEVHAFCLMTTHFHLLVRSPTGRLSEAMRRIQNEYVRHFNRTRRRDGPLFRGRFISKPVLSLTYRRVLVRYIDQNPVHARICSTPWAFPYGSAVRFATGKIPRWLSRDWVMGRVEDEARIDSHATYASVWGRSVAKTERDLVELRMAGRALSEDDLDDLIASAPKQVRSWMVHKARLADGTRPGAVCVPPGVVMAVVERQRQRGRIWRYDTATEQRRDAWGIATVGLLRDLAGEVHRAIAERLGIRTSTVGQRLRAHWTLCATDAYASRLARIATLCLREAFPGEGKERKSSIVS